MAHPPVQQSRRRPATATAESGQRQRSPGKAWRSHLNSLPVFVGSRCDGAAYPNHSIERGVTCLGTRRGGVNDPAVLPAWRPGRLHPCRWLGGPVGPPMAKKHPPRGEGPSHSPADGGQLPFESNVGAFREESAAGSPVALNRPASCEPCPGAARMSAPPPGCSSPPPLPTGEPADIRPPCTSITPPISSTSSL